LRTTNFYGGPEKQIYYHALTASQSKIMITVASLTTTTEKPELLLRLDAKGIKTKTLKSSHSYDFHTISTLRKFIQEEGYDLICTHDYRSAIITCLARLNTNCKWIAFSRGWTYENSKVLIFHILETILYNLSDFVIAVSNYQKHRIARYILSRKKISVVRNCIELPEVDNLTALSVREKYGLPEESIIIASAGRFSREKGQIYLIKAAFELLEHNKKLYFIMFGDGPDYHKLKMLVNNSDYSNHILLPGHEAEVLKYIKGGVDMVINPSLSEGLPNIILESMALEVPVIASDVGGVSEIVSNNETGILVNSKDHKKLAVAIKSLLENNELAKNITSAARLHVKNNFNFTGQFKALKSVYENIFNDKC